MKILMSRREAAAALGVGLTTFDEHVASSLPAVKVGRRVMFRTRDVEAWVDRAAGNGIDDNHVR